MGINASTTPSPGNKQLACQKGGLVAGGFQSSGGNEFYRALGGHFGESAAVACAVATPHFAATARRFAALKPSFVHGPAWAIAVMRLRLWEPPFVVPMDASGPSRIAGPTGSSSPRFLPPESEVVHTGCHAIAFRTDHDVLQSLDVFDGIAYPSRTHQRVP